MTNEQKERIKQEEFQLNIRLKKLNTFMQTEKFFKLEPKQKALMYKQLIGMEMYLEALRLRAKLNNITLYKENENNE